MAFGTAALFACSDSESDNGEPTVIGIDGGTVRAPGDMALVEVPPGALSSDTPILVAEVSTADLPDLPDGLTLPGRAFAFTPHGTTFASPVSLQLSYDPSASGALQVVRLDDEADPTWEVLSGATYAGGMAMIEESRFSVLGVASTTSTPVLTVVGTATPDAIITLSVGSQTFTAVADGTGNYSIGIADTSPNDLVSITARGSAARGEGTIELATYLDTMTELLSQAGSDARLDASENAATQLSPFTTARYALINEANGGTMPSARSALLDAERQINATSSLGFADMAAVIQLVIDTPTLLTAPQTTLSLASDKYAVIDFAYANSDRETSGRPALDAGRERLVSRAELFLPFTNPPTGIVVESFVPQREGVVSLGRGPVLSFGANQMGTYQPTVRERIDPALPEVGFDWRIATSGALLVDFLQSPLVTFPSGVPDHVLDLLDSALVEQIRQANPQPTQVRTELVGLEYSRVPGFIGIDVVATVSVTRWYLNEAYRPAGLNVPDVDVRANGSVGSTWTRQADINFIPFSDAQVRGKSWPIRIFGPSRYATLFADFNVDEDVLAHTLVTFNDDPGQTATAEAGGLLANPMTLTWSLLADGSVELTYPDGTKQRLRIVADLGREYGVWSELDVFGIQFIDYFRTVAIDSLLPVTLATLTTPTTRYWQNTINIPYSVRRRNEVVTDWERFGFQFFNPGEAYRLTSFMANATPESIEDFWSFGISDGRIEIDAYISDSGINVQGCPGPASCLVWRQRQWTPLKLDDGWLYVLEFDKRLPNPSVVTWDATSQVWRDGNGDEADDSLFTWLISPRINAYFLTDLNLP